MEERLIKRYRNRKLYDTFQSSYITLEELANIIRAGVDVKVVNSKSLEDITYQTLIQLLHERERKQGGFDVELLTRSIKSLDGTLTGYIKEMEGTFVPAAATNSTPASESVLLN